MHELFSGTKGNSDLKEESAWKFEVSTQQPFAVAAAAGNLDFSLYYNIVDDKVDLITLPDYSQQYNNIDRVQSYGLEAAFKCKFISEHCFQYRYLDYSNLSDRPLNENPHNIVTITEKITLPYDIFFVYDASWHDISSSENHILPAYWLHNFYLNKAFSRFKLKFGLENAFDQNYQTKYAYPQPGMNFVLSLETKVF